ncbi:MAG: DUF2156 domain-containing protein [Candidatus Omnitrophica bacterium]|nr:DUF2156 domain-containing protein [Candidatus Omnitrophota bacterium]
MTSLEQLSLTHQNDLQGRFKRTHTYIAEYSFANLYLFRNSHGHQLLKHDGHLFVIGKTYDGKPYIMPTSDLTPEIVDVLYGLSGEYPCVFPVPEEWLGAFGKYAVSSIWDEGDSDYVYAVEKMATFKGQKLHSKKNLLNQCVALYKPQPKPLTRGLMKDALLVLDAWQDDATEAKEQTDYFPCREALDHYEDLVLCGGIYYVDNEPAGFIIGEEINNDMFALHFAKGKRKFKGMYQFMFNHFAGILPRKYAFLNFEQDIGKLALRIAKSSYYPDQVIKKYRVTFKHG